MSDKDPTVWKETIRILAPAKEVWRALTEPDALQQWFAEHVEVDPERGCYAFSGKWIPWGIHPDRATQRLTRFEPNVGFAFKWQFKDIPTEFSIDLKEDGSATEATLNHRLDGKQDLYQFWIVRDYATIYLQNLRSFVERGVASCLPDFSKDRDVAVCSVEIDATPESVFRALTVPMEMAKWLSPKSEVELKVGGSYSFGWTEEKNGETRPMGPQHILELEPNRLLAYDWTCGDEPRTQARWEIESLSGGKTMLTVTHSGFGPDCDVTDYINGWGGFLALGKAMLEARQGDTLKSGVGEAS